jgi:ubiquilin
MADNTETGADAQVTFKVKTSGDKTHTITMSESAKVLDLKTKLAGEEFENVPVDRQRLIYSGRVMKNDDALSAYKIKAGNTVHMVKSAASNPAAGAASSAPTPQAVPQNMAAGTAANNPLAGLTGARYAGLANLPSASLFGADGGVCQFRILHCRHANDLTFPFDSVDGCTTECGSNGRHAVKPCHGADPERGLEQSCCR